ncbi:undecaprenyl-diphosphate phosphatase [Kosakonia oryziphila]|uniref:undecaprenyl-diphosphate phosphatase n=1 Tax=Kosakonia oryziphila TaxID=1005667 RepID=A0A1C4GL09_9ENTR|nr:undecaprenyl-diphosphate phosphatase [Kosakonia oryziphila]SCC68898.1 undecaprenyl-diphosphatase [Kosakonia oryziphila]
MLESLNHTLFYWINATPDSPHWLIALAEFSASDLISIVPLLAVGLWLWGPSAQRQLVIKVSMAIVVSMCISLLLGHLLPHDRPFAAHVGYNFLPHAPDSSFPSDHGTVIFTFAVAFLAWHRLWSGAVLMAVGLTIAWSRVYLGVHWPLDMFGALLVGISGCLSAQILWQGFGPALYRIIQQCYRFCFATLIRRGWVRD